MTLHLTHRVYGYLAGYHRLLLLPVYACVYSCLRCSADTCRVYCCALRVYLPQLIYRCFVLITFVPVPVHVAANVSPDARLYALYRG